MALKQVAVLVDPELWSRIKKQAASSEGTRIRDIVNAALKMYLGTVRNEAQTSDNDEPPFV